VQKVAAMRALLLLTISVACTICAACGGTGSGEAQETGGPDAGVDATPEPANGGSCNVVVTHATPLMAASHVPQDSTVIWNSNPPSSGPHYPTHVDWATTYPVEVPRGNYLHNEEHGGVVLIYNCPGGGCQSVVDGLTAIGTGLPQDPKCTPYAGVNAKWLVTGDHLLPDGVQVAAAAWGWTYTASCLDSRSLTQFVLARYSQGGSDRNDCTPQAP
jgi:hypothetical protein